MFEYKKFLLIGAKIDLLLFSLLAIPFISTKVLDSLFYLGSLLGDSRILPNLSDPFTQLSLCLFGAFGLFTVWARINNPSLLVGKMVGIVKLYAVCLFGFALLSGAPLILLVFLLSDLINGSLLFLKGRSV